MFLSSGVASARELWEQPWIEVRSPHFVIVSAVSEERTAELARELESFRQAVRIVTDIGDFEEHIPTTLYVLPYRVEQLGLTVNVGAYLLPLMRANYAVVAPWSQPLSGSTTYCTTNGIPQQSERTQSEPPVCISPRLPGASGTELDRLLKHEYVHFLMHNNGMLGYPWFDEGYAEMLSTLTVHGNTIEYGQATEDRLSWLRYERLMSFTSLLETRNVVAFNSDNNGKFYVQSWLLLHYLINARPGRELEDDNRKYIELTDAGATPTDAFEQAYGLKVAQLDLNLTRYWKKIRLNRVTMAEPFPEVPVQVQAIGADSIAARLGLLTLLSGKTDEAKRFWDSALALNPNNVTALVGLGDLHKLAGQFDEGLPYYEKAIALEPQNANTELNFAEYFLARAAVNGARENEVSDDLVEARKHFARSYRLDPNNPETLAMNGSTYLFPGQQIDKALQSLTTSYEMLPSQPDIKLLLATAYVKSGDRQNAIRLLRSLVTWSHGTSAKKADKLLQKLVAMGADERGTARQTATDE
jgi:FimV-like protein